jgi:Response regulators consisting of a CheY-like receiver domain and a winged-helix DNA-binding domain
MLIVDDDVESSIALKSAIEPEGWLVELCANGLDAQQLLQNFDFDFILLDWQLPDITGPEICKQFRNSGGLTPIIFLTGRQAIEDIEHGLNSGGDDYLTKPFSVRELLARIRTVRRRELQVNQAKIRLKQLEFDPRLRIITRDGENVQLSPTESSMLEALCRKPNTYFSSLELFKAVWPSESESSEEVVRTHMKVLRRKLKLLTQDEVIQTVRGSGYLVRAEDIQGA